MPNKTNHERIKKATNILRIFTLICFWGSMAAAGITAIIALILIFVPGAYSFFMMPLNLNKSGISGKLGIELSDMLRYTFDSDVSMGIKMKPSFFAIIIRTSICGMIIAPFFYQLSRILRSVQRDKPFEPYNARRLTMMGILLIAYSIAYRAGDYVILHSALNTINDPNLTVNYSFDTTGMLMGLLLFILAGIFKYGSYLQKEYDTTL